MHLTLNLEHVEHMLECCLLVKTTIIVSQVCLRFNIQNWGELISTGGLLYISPQQFKFFDFCY